MGLEPMPHGLTLPHLLLYKPTNVSCCGLDYFLTISFDLGSPCIVSTPFYLESHHQSLCHHKRGFCLLAVFYIPTMLIAVFSFRKGCTLISKSVALSLLSYGQICFLNAHKLHYLLSVSFYMFSFYFHYFSFHLVFSSFQPLLFQILLMIHIFQFENPCFGC